MLLKYHTSKRIKREKRKKDYMTPFLNRVSREGLKLGFLGTARKTAD